MELDVVAFIGARMPRPSFALEFAGLTPTYGLRRRRCPHDEYGAVGILDNLLRDGAEQQTVEGRKPARADHNAASTEQFAQLDEALCGLPHECMQPPCKTPRVEQGARVRTRGQTTDRKFRLGGFGAQPMMHGGDVERVGTALSRQLHGLGQRMHRMC